MGAVSAASGATDMKKQTSADGKTHQCRAHENTKLVERGAQKKKTAGAEMWKHNRKESASISHTEQQWSLTTGPMGNLLGGLQEHGNMPSDNRK